MSIAMHSIAPKGKTCAWVGSPTKLAIISDKNLITNNILLTFN